MSPSKETRQLWLRQIAAVARMEVVKNLFTLRAAPDVEFGAAPLGILRPRGDVVTVVRAAGDVVDRGRRTRDRPPKPLSVCSTLPPLR